jgi:hypothetical protein
MDGFVMVMMLALAAGLLDRQHYCAAGGNDASELGRIGGSCRQLRERGSDH